MSGRQVIMNKTKIVIVGGGFGGVAAAKSLSKLKNVEITLIDRRNHHLFQPLLYQVAIAGLNPADISVPLRTLFKKYKNVQIQLDEVSRIDAKNKKIQCGSDWVTYDYLVMAAGSKHSYFGQNQWEEFAPGLKTLEQALEIRRRVLMSFEMAEKADTAAEIERCLTFVIVGGGPTGVELAGGIAELAFKTMRKEFKVADLSKTKVILIEAGDRVLASFPESLSAIAKKNLEELGVNVILNSRASNLSADGLSIGDQFIPSRTILWAAGVLTSSVTAEVPGPKDRQWRVVVNPDLSTTDDKDIFAIGDMASFKEESGNTLPGLAPVAMQQGKFLAQVIGADLKNKPRPAFKYFDKGSMATIGRKKAVLTFKGIKMSGLTAWLAWVFIHIMYLAGFKNRFFVFLQWAWSYFTFGRGSRLITYKTWRFYNGEKLDLE